MSSGSPPSVTASNAEAERLQLSPQSQPQPSSQLQKASEEKSSDVGPSNKGAPNATAHRDAGGEPDSKDGGLAVSGKPVTSEKQKQEEGNQKASGIQKKQDNDEDKENLMSSREDGGYAPNVFYVYARRVCPKHYLGDSNQY